MIKFQIQDILTVLRENMEVGHKVLRNDRKYDELVRSQLREEKCIKGI